jgi:hypothetical protein
VVVEQHLRVLCYAMLCYVAMLCCGEVLLRPILEWKVRNAVGLS